jgi:hypothetical protein
MRNYSSANDSSCWGAIISGAAAGPSPNFTGSGWGGSASGEQSANDAPPCTPFSDVLSGSQCSGNQSIFTPWGSSFLAATLPSTGAVDMPRPLQPIGSSSTQQQQQQQRQHALGRSSPTEAFPFISRNGCAQSPAAPKQRRMSGEPSRPPHHPRDSGTESITPGATPLTGQSLDSGTGTPMAAVHAATATVGPEPAFAGCHANLLIPVTDLELGGDAAAVLGRGGFGMVLKGKWRVRGWVGGAAFGTACWAEWASLSACLAHLSSID